MSILNKYKNTNLIVYIFLVVIGMFIVNNNFFNNQAGFTVFEFSSLFGLYLLLLTSFLIIGRKFFKYRLALLIPLFVIFILSTIMSLTMVSPQDFDVLGLHGEYWTVHFEIDWFYRFESICRFIVVLSIAYSSFILLPQLLDSNNKLAVVAALINFVCLGLLIYSLIAEFNNYIIFVKSVIEKNYETMYLATPKCLFPNKNCFAFVLLLGILADLLMHHYKRNVISYILLPFYFVVIVFTICKTVFILAIAIVAFYVLYRLISTLKEHKTRSIIALSIFGVIAAGVVITVLVVSPIREILVALFFGVGKRTVQVRNYVWSNVALVLNGGGWFLGRGFGTFDALVRVYNYADPGGGEAYVDNAHNGYLELIGQGGVFFLALAFAFEIYFIYKCIRQFKKNQELCLLELVYFASIHVYMFFEAMTPVFSYALDHLCTNIILFIPILSLDYAQQYETIKEKKPIKDSLLVTLFSSISIILFAILFTSKPLWLDSGISSIFIGLTIALEVIYLASAIILFIINKSTLPIIAETTGMIVIVCSVWSVVSTNMYSPLLLAIAPILSLAVFLLINGLIKKLPLSNAYGEIYEYIDNSFNNAFLKVRSE